MNESNEEHQEVKTPKTKKGSDRFQTVVAVIIAVVSVISAGVIWRASIAGSSASTADRQGLISVIKHEAAYAENVSMLYQEAQYAIRHASYLARADALKAHDSLAARSEAEWVNQIVVNLALFTPLVTDPTYRTAEGGLDLDARLEDLRAADADLRDLDPQQDFGAADQFYTEAQVLVSMVIIFAVALFSLTLAEITQHKIRLGLAMIGVVVFLAGLAGVVIAELYFVLSRIIAA